MVPKMAAVIYHHIYIYIYSPTIQDNHGGKMVPTTASPKGPGNPNTRSFVAAGYLKSD